MRHFYLSRQLLLHGIVALEFLPVNHVVTGMLYALPARAEFLSRRRFS